MRLFRAPVALAFVAMTACAQPSPRGLVQGDDFDAKSWEEQKSRLPPYPKPENLARINVGPATSFEFYVDTVSVSVIRDEAVRYTLVARSPSGAMNVSYEGIRCKTSERKSYAFGRFDGSWSQARNPQWLPINPTQANRQHAVLAEDFFCPRGLQVRTAEEAAQALRRGNQPGLVR